MSYLFATLDSVQDTRQLLANGVVPGKSNICEV